MSVHDNIFHNYKDFNPFWQARSPSYLERRHELFITFRRRTPGLISKGSILLIVFCSTYCLHVMNTTRRERERMNMITYEYQRKALPFIQAIEDRRFLAVEQRKKWLNEELFKGNEEEFLALSRLFNNPTIWAEPFSRTSIFLNGIPTRYKGSVRGMANFLTGLDSYKKNAPGTHF